MLRALETKLSALGPRTGQTRKTATLDPWMLVGEIGDYGFGRSLVLAVLESRDGPNRGVLGQRQRIVGVCAVYRGAAEIQEVSHASRRTRPRGRWSRLRRWPLRIASRSWPGLREKARWTTESIPCSANRSASRGVTLCCRKTTLAVCCLAAGCWRQVVYRWRQPARRRRSFRGALSGCGRRIPRRP